MKIFRSKGSRIFSALLFFCAAYLFFAHEKESPLPSVERKFPVMGTLCHFRLTGEEGTQKKDLCHAADAVQDTFYRIEKMCNIFDEKSTLTRINRNIKAGKEEKCPEELWQLFREARFFHTYSQGAFDVTIAPLMRLWGFHRKNVTLPGKDAISAAKAGTGLDKLFFDDSKHSISCRQKKHAPAFDLGGIAKGYALDKAAETAAAHGIRRGLLDLGGNLRSLEHSPGKKKKNHIIGIRDPLGSRKIAETILLPNNMSIATSGNYERYVVFDNKRYTHILDARTGYPVSGMLSVTVITPKGVHADALSTSIFILGEKFAGKVYRDFPETSILLFREEEGKLLRKAWGLFAEKQ